MISPFRIGLSGCAGGLEVSSTRELLEFTEHAEELGFDGLWFNEQHFQGIEQDGRRCLSPLMLAAAVAARTKRLRLGFSLLLMGLHQPIRLAEDLATLDVLSNGRVDFGVSRGGTPKEHFVFGNGLADDFDGALDLILRAWQPGEVSLGCGAVSVEPKPLQFPHPPVFIGTYTEKTAEAAGRAGHRLICHGITSPEKIATLIQAFCDGGGDAADVPVGRFVYVSDTDVKARQELWPTLLKLTDRLRTVAQKKASIIRVEDLQPEIFYERMVIAGSPQTCAQKIRKLHAGLGTTYLNALSAFFGFLPEHLLFPSLELLAREVKPLLMRDFSC
jgi:alkanesulfonate monooxygenase SsuD/methylene tetrahydromethanopterin reductase-like flavin-dependent oxidoreductase (luciferase family)